MPLKAGLTLRMGRKGHGHGQNNYVRISPFKKNLLTAFTKTNKVTAIMTQQGAGVVTKVAYNAYNIMGDGTIISFVDFSFPTLIGKTYSFKYTVSSVAASSTISIGTSQGGVQILAASSRAGIASYVETFVATSTTTWVRDSRFPAATPTSITALRFEQTPTAVALNS